MRFSLGSELTYTVLRQTTMILNIEAQRSLGGQRVISENFSVSPNVPVDAFEAQETANRYRRLLLAPGTYTVRYEAEIDTQPLLRESSSVDQVSMEQLPLNVMPYLFPSRYCESDQLARYAWRRFGDLPEGHARVEAICDWIHDNVDYLEGSSDGSTSAYDTFTTRAGVCRDFAHLAITFCRALGIPARFVSAYGYMLEPQDFHAVIEAFLDGRWYAFDPTRLSPPHGLVHIGIGRDAADTAFATFFGQIESQPKLVWVNEIGRPQPLEAEAVSYSAY